MDRALPATTDPSIKDLSCQVYEEGDCKHIIGFDGHSVQIYTLELVRCQGEIPVDPGCQSNMNSRFAANVADAEPGAAQPRASCLWWNRTRQRGEPLALAPLFCP